MAGLTNTKPGDSYASLLRINNNTAGIESALVVVTDGLGEETPLLLSDAKLLIKDTNTTSLFEVQTSAAAVVLSVDTTNSRVGIGVADPDTMLEIFKAGTQLKLSYDASSYITMAVDTSSHLTIATAESGIIKLSDAMTISAGDATLTDGNLVITSITKGIVHTNRGAVTQGTSATTAVTLNATSGIITTYAATLATNTEVQFTLTNSSIQADSLILVSLNDMTTQTNSKMIVTTNTIAGGSCIINLFNAGSGTADAVACNVHFLIINNS